MFRLFERFRKMWRDDRGVAAIVFALAALPMVGAAGVAIDMANVARVKSRMQAAADAAALAGARAFNAPGMESNVPYAMDAARDRAAGFFAANIDKAFIDSPAETTIDVDPATYDKLTVTLTYHGVAPTGVMSFFKTPRVKFSGTAKASVIMPNYIDVYLVLDVSGSMARPRTTTGMKDLRARYISAKPTAFTYYSSCTCACHEPPNWLTTDMTTNGWNIARANPSIDLKIDAAKRALNQFVAAAKSQSLYNHVNFALYTMTNTTLTKISDLTANYDAVTASIDAVDIFKDAGTDFTNLLASFNRDVSNELTRTTRSTYLQFGKTGSGRKTYVFFVTDGLNVTLVNWGTAAVQRLHNQGIAHPGHKGGAFDPSLCQQFKDKNVSVGVIYVQGAWDSGDPTFDYLEGPYVNDAVANLNSCASPGYFVDATWTDYSVSVLTSKLFANMGDDVLVRLTK